MEVEASGWPYPLAHRRRDGRAEPAPCSGQGPRNRKVRGSDRGGLVGRLGRPGGSGGQAAQGEEGGFFSFIIFYLFLFAICLAAKTFVKNVQPGQIIVMQFTAPLQKVWEQYNLI